MRRDALFKWEGVSSPGVRTHLLAEGFLDIYYTAHRTVILTLPSE